MSLQNPAVVKALEQGEFLITLMLTVFYFGERISLCELLGMVLIMTGILTLLVVA